MHLLIEQYACQNSECEFHGCKYTLRRFDVDDYSSDAYCRECGSPAEYVGDRKARWCTVAVYLVDRAYGGPEEGGWWYDQGSLFPATVRAFERCDFPQLVEWVEHMSRRYESSENERFEVKVYLERSAPVSFPESIPRYS